MKIERPIYRTTSPLSTNKALYKNEAMLTFGWKSKFLNKKIVLQDKEDIRNLQNKLNNQYDEGLIKKVLGWAGCGDLNKNDGALFKKQKKSK